MTTFIVTVHVY